MTPRGTGRWSAVNNDGDGQFSVTVVGRDCNDGRWAGFKVQLTTDDAYVLMRKLDRVLEDHLQPPLG